MGTRIVNTGVKYSISRKVVDYRPEWINYKVVYLCI